MYVFSHSGFASTNLKADKGGRRSKRSPAAWHKVMIMKTFRKKKARNCWHIREKVLPLHRFSA